MTDSQADANRQGALGWIHALERSDFPAIFALHADDVVINLLGTTPVSGCGVGRDDYFAYTNAEVMTKLDPAQEPYLKRWRLACADRNAAAILFQGGFPALDGDPVGRYDQNYLAIVQASAGKIRKLTEMVDTAMIETAIYRRRFKHVRTAPRHPFNLDLARADASAGGRRTDHIRLIEDWLDSINRQDASAYSSYLAEGLVANIVGTTPYSGRTLGRQAFLDLPFDFHADLFLRGSRDVGRRYRIMCADDRAVCVLIRGGGISSKAVPYDQHYSIVAQVIDGQIGELHIHLDTALAEQVVFENPFVDPGRLSPHSKFSMF